MPGNISQNLHLDMPGIFNETLHEEGLISEGLLGLCGCTFKFRLQDALLPDDANAPSAAAGSRLQQNRVADFVGNPPRFPEIFQPARA